MEQYIKTNTMPVNTVKAQKMGIAFLDWSLQLTVE
jgi:hypothetical protein